MSNLDELADLAFGQGRYEGCTCPDPLRAVLPSCPLHGFDAASGPMETPTQEPKEQK